MLKQESAGRLSKVFMTQRFPPEVLLLLVAIFWGTSYGFTKQALVYVSITAFLVIRFTLTFLLLLPKCIAEYRVGQRHDMLCAMPTGIILLGIFCCEVYGVYYTSASNAVFLISLCVVITPFVEWVTTQKRPPTHIVWAGVVSLIGIGLLTLRDFSALTLNRGDLLILSAAVLRAIMVVLTQRVYRKRKLSALSLTTVQSGVVALGCWMLFIWQGDSLITLVAVGAEFWSIVLYLVLACTLFAFYAQNYAVQHLSPSKVNLLLGSEPIFGAVFAVVFFDEALTGWQWFGGGLIVLATARITLLRHSKLRE
ncbi:DMT family transporter [Thaumasiovibrio sp. DFM-14]|uniref:DMT family transporter n=1 Tax=Thaumasiovibrio sp. DFM-14 TaxID=3384792 RepID=UPI0039A21A48